MCSHYLIFRPNKESSIWRQNDHRDVMQNLSTPFHLSIRVSDENRVCSISICFFFLKITDPCVGRSFSMCSHDPTFGTNKIGSLKTDRVNGP